MKRINLLFTFLLFISWSNAATYLVQPGGAGAVWSGVTGTVVDLTTEAKSLNEWYAATTFTSSDQIWIIKGTYTLTDTIATKTTEKLYGGFAGTEQVIGDRVKGTNAWDFTNETIIDGNSLVRGFVSNTGATIDGLTIQNCMYAGAVLNTGTAAKITNSSVLQKCIVRNNTTTGVSSAGGVYLTTTGKLLNSYIHHNANTNTTQNGGGVFINGGATVDGCTITYNTTGGAGGGIEIEGKAGGTVINNCIVSNNESKAQGGGGINATNTITFDAGTALTISNSTISSNIAKVNGGGISIDARVTVVNEGTDWNDKNIINILNCVLNSNTALSGGGAFLKRGRHNFYGCTLNDNVSTAPNNDGTGGGGIFIQSSNGSGLSISNSVFKGNIIGNNAKNAGSAINTSMYLTLKNCLITGNKGSSVISQNPGIIGTYQNCTFASNLNWAGAEVGIYLGWQVGAISTFTNCLFYKSSANPISGTINPGYDPIVTYCGFDLAAVPMTYTSKTGCITALTSASFTDAANGDWSLSPTSAAINAGTTIPAITTDITGTLRPQGTGYDIGAYETPSTISSFTPTSGVNGTTVTINGSNLTGTTAVSFGGVAASSFTVNSDTQITAIVGLGGTGNVSVTTPGGIGTMAGFTCTGYLPAPVITSYTPLSGASGISVTITGTNLTGATAVSFGGIAAKSITSNSATQIIAKTNSASVGIVSVTTPSGTVSLGAPTITSFTPTTVGYTASVVITGTFLTGTSAVKFGGTAAMSYIVNSDTQITAIVGSGTSGSVSVTTPLGTGTLAGFVWFSPTISSFTPTSGVSGTSVVITGTNLTGATAVGFGNTAASSFTIDSDTQITALVGSGSAGTVSVTTPSGIAYKTGFTWPAPTVTSFTPTSGASGTTVTINGTNFLSATSVSFGGTAVSSFVVVSATQITAIVGTGSTGSVSVTTPGGTATKTGFSSIVTEIDNTGAANLTLSVYKNATGQIIINRDETIGSEGMITIYNALGNKLVHANTTGKITVINKSFGSGIYLVSVDVAGKNITRKVIIN